MWQLYRGGFLNAVSVGFLPLEEPKPLYDADGHMVGNEFTKQELLEISSVPVPANPSCLSKAIQKGILTPEQAKAFEADPLDDLFRKLFPPPANDEKLEQFLADLQRRSSPVSALFGN